MTEKTLGARKIAPVAWATFFDDVFNWIVENDFRPEKAERVVELVFFWELTIKAPTDAFKKPVTRERHEIAADVKFDDISRAFVIV